MLFYVQCLYRHMKMCADFIHKYLRKPLGLKSEFQMVSSCLIVILVIKLTMLFRYNLRKIYIL